MIKWIKRKTGKEHEYVPDMFYQPPRGIKELNEEDIKQFGYDRSGNLYWRGKIIKTDPNKVTNRLFLVFSILSVLNLTYALILLIL